LPPQGSVRGMGCYFNVDWTTGWNQASCWSWESVECKGTWCATSGKRNYLHEKYRFS
jgi:hypothetical protein